MAHSSENNKRYIVQVFVGALSDQYEALSVEASKQTSAEEIVSCISDKLSLNDVTGESYELAEVVGDVVGGECKERRLGPSEYPVAVMLLWPNNTSGQYYRFYLREKICEEPWMENFSVELIKDYFQRFLCQPNDKEYPDLCQLPDLNEQTLLDNLRARFLARYIYTYVGSILIALNPFKFYPIYNPKYVKLYQNMRLGNSLPPHIFAVADSAYHCMLKDQKNQCIVISGESGSGKTESTNFLLHHLTALSQKGSYGSGVEQTILSAGPVLEAFGNAKTAHNNNSSRFGKFIQVNYKENGMVHGAVVQKYLLEKSRICSQGRNERNYHVFYYLLAGASEEERQQLHLMSVDKYNYLNRSGVCGLPGVDESYEFTRLKQSMEMVGFTFDKQRRLFAVLSAVLLLGNVEFQSRKSYHHDEAVSVKNPEVVSLISQLLRVKKDTLIAALTAKRARASGETLVINYRMPEATATRDAMAKCLYGALFDWIVMQVNHALLSKKDTLREHQGNSIGVLDIFGFEDFGPCNSFEQLCINYANEHLQYYFNQHVFKYEQEEYRREHIRWTDIGFSDNTACLQLIEGKPRGLLCVLDDQCNFPWATNETLLQKYNSLHEDNIFYEKPTKKEPAFIVRHYAGTVKYQVSNMREKNLDLMRADIVGVLKNSSLAFVRELVGADPVAVFRWAILRAFFRGYFAFHEAGRKARAGRVDIQRPHQRNDSILSVTSWRRNCATTAAGGNNGTKKGKGAVEEADVMRRASQIVMKNKSFRPRERSKKGLKNLQTVKTLAGRTGTASATSGKGRKQPATVAAQFQQSLHALMDTLNQANPFFIRCIKSNSEKIPNVFDEETVQRQLRYTGMLETVRIRQAGYNVRLTYEEFIQLYRILLPKGLLSSQADVRNFLATLNLNRDNYQLGATKIFMRESEQTKLEHRLHQQIMASIITIQRWFRAVLERRRFLALRKATVVIQTYCRRWYIGRVWAAVRVQTWWRGARTRRWYTNFRRALLHFQAHTRGYLLRRRLATTRRQLEPSGATVQAIDKITDIIDVQLNMLLKEEEAERARSLRATQSLPLEKQSIEKTWDTSLDKPRVLTYSKRKVTKTHNINDNIHKQNSRSICAEGQPWPLSEAAQIKPGNKITPEGLARELIWLKMDQNHLRGDHNHQSIEEETAASIALSSEEYLRKFENTKDTMDSRPHNSTCQITAATTNWRRSGTYQRSLSSTSLEGNLVTLPPVRRELYPTRNHKTGVPAVPARKSKLIANVDSVEMKSKISRGPETIARRRNSDPAQAAVLTISKEPNSIYDSTFIGAAENGLFRIAGHRFRKERRLNKSDKCAFCFEGVDEFVRQGQRCTDCKQLLHTKCIQNKEVISMPCTPAPRGRKKYRKAATTSDASKVATQPKFNLTGTSEFTDRTDKIVSDAEELKGLQDFIAKKMEAATTDNSSAADKVFRRALKEFKDNLTATYSVVNKQGAALKYKDLIDNFMHVMQSVCQREGGTAERFPVTMGVNAFRGFMNEFMNLKRDPEKVKTKWKKEKKRKADDPIQFNGHSFILLIVNVQTECEICKVFFMWPIEKSLTCRTCKFVAHKKCYTKAWKCSGGVSRCGRIFGRPLHELIEPGMSLPKVVAELLTKIEMNGLYVEGLYRKSGLSSKVQELKRLLDEDPEAGIARLEQYAVHVRTSVLKLFLRDMPEPLLTFEFYDHFIRAAQVSDTQDRVSTLFSLLKRLPMPNFALMERLMFHLALVANKEEHNRMGPNALAIVFAPCILRTNKCQPAQDSLGDIARQTLCIETILCENLRRIRQRLEEIATLESAQSEAERRLANTARGTNRSLELAEKIKEMQNEKDTLQAALAQFTSRSDDDLISTDGDEQQTL